MFLIEVRVGGGPWMPFDIADTTLRDVLDFPPCGRYGRPYDRHNWRARRIHHTSRSHYEAEIRQIWQPD